ncbi:hypothetical protein O6P43_011358 [Quillaja saponaria]|uniref:Uncharacterized protein n=1 Tax=Quillaja saponaria TaxID=32244 RepID=A0AAD7LZB4_QUISA|nr:hypothetical protein O6P43_011358 [Quillaja saponaria]
MKPLLPRGPLQPSFPLQFFSLVPRIQVYGWVSSVGLCIVLAADLFFLPIVPWFCPCKQERNSNLWLGSPSYVSCIPAIFWSWFVKHGEAEQWPTFGFGTTLFHAVYQL